MKHSKKYRSELRNYQRLSRYHQKEYDGLLKEFIGYKAGVCDVLDRIGKGAKGT